MEHYEAATASVIFTVVVVPVTRSQFFCFAVNIPLWVRLEVMGAKTELLAGDPSSTFGVAAFDK